MRHKVINIDLLTSPHSFELEVQVMETMKRVLGQEHPDMLTSMANLASTFPKARTMEGGSRAGGTSNGDKFEGAREGASRHADQHGNLASTYWNQEQWKEAEELGVQVIETSLRVLGKEHPDTLTSSYQDSILRHSYTVTVMCISMEFLV
jgi:hypothetical protein